MRERWQLLLILVVLSVGLLGGGVVGAVVFDDESTESTVTKPSVQSDRPGGTATTAESAPQFRPVSTNSTYTGLYNQTIDSVVTVQVETFSGGGQGSGFVYDSQGHIVTNQHVVGSAKQVLVRFADGNWREATVLGTDAYTDLAVLEVENLPDGVDPLPIAASDPSPGQRVVALGSPLGLEGSISSGIVSGVNRTMSTDGGFSIPATVQTDAPINPGNSGGPLVSLDGTVVGVNRAKQADNIGFAISPQIVERVVPGLIRDGSYDHPYMGIRTVPVTPTKAQANDLDQARGVMVAGVLQQGPAAGVLEPADSRTRVDGRTVRTGGDIILSIDGRTIRSQQQLSRALMLHTSPGETVSVTVIRNGERQTLDIELTERPRITR